MYEKKLYENPGQKHDQEGSSYSLCLAWTWLAGMLWSEHVVSILGLF